jgi:hypothetical protein
VGWRRVEGDDGCSDSWGDEPEHPLGPIHVTELERTEVDQPSPGRQVVYRQVSGGAADQDVAAGTQCSQPSRAIHRWPEVVAVALDRLSRVEGESHRQPSGRRPGFGDQAALGVERGADCVTRAAEDAERGITLASGLEHRAVVCSHGSLDQRDVAYEGDVDRVGGSLPHARRPDDVGHHQRHDSGRKLHGPPHFRQYRAPPREPTWKPRSEKPYHRRMRARPGRTHDAAMTKNTTSTTFPVRGRVGTDDKRKDPSMTRRTLCLIGMSAIASSLALAATPVAARQTTLPATATVDTVAADTLAANPTALSRHSATRLVQSTGNLYWTTNQTNEHGTPTHQSKVLRASKSNTPGNERVLYQEARNERFTFNALSYANVGGRWFGYFVVNYTDRGISQIKRIPLEGGPAVVVATAPRVILQRDLVTDGSVLYWADAGGLHKMPIGGGPITTLVSGTSIKRVGLDQMRVFYSAGASIRSVPKAGGDVTTHVMGAFGSPEITAMIIRPTVVILPITAIYWGDMAGAVKSRLVGLFTTVQQAPIPGRQTTSVNVDGNRVLWTDCVNGNQCNVRKRVGGTTTVVSTDRVGARDVHGDTQAMYWSDTTGVMRYTH